MISRIAAVEIEYYMNSEAGVKAESVTASSISTPRNRSPHGMRLRVTEAGPLALGLCGAVGRQAIRTAECANPSVPRLMSTSNRQEAAAEDEI